MNPGSRRHSIRHIGALVIAATAVLALAVPVAARETVDPSTLNPAPPASWDVTCYREGSGITCDLSFVDDLIVDEPSGIVCGAVEVLFSETRFVVGKRIYDADGDLLQRHFRESLSGTFTNPESGLVATWVQHDTVIHNLGTPGDLGSGAEQVSGLITRLIGPDGRTILTDTGTYQFDDATGELLRLGGPHPFFEYFDLGDATALQPLCDAID